MPHLQKQGLVIWLTGLSGSGKTTIAQNVLNILSHEHVLSLIVDGDMIRTELHQDLGFSREDIIKNNLLIIEYCRKNLGKYLVQLVPVIAPFRLTRQKARQVLGKAYKEVYVQASLEKCKERDTKGLYAKAESGQLPNMIGVDPQTPYETPIAPDFIVQTEVETIESASQKVYDYIRTELKLQQTHL